jgi:hypothetical protein
MYVDLLLKAMRPNTSNEPALLPSDEQHLCVIASLPRNSLLVHQDLKALLVQVVTEWIASSSLPELVGVVRFSSTLELSPLLFSLLSSLSFLPIAVACSLAPVAPLARSLLSPVCVWYSLAYSLAICPAASSHPAWFSASCTWPLPVGLAGGSELHARAQALQAPGSGSCVVCHRGETSATAARQRVIRPRDISSPTLRPSVADTTA